MLWPETSQHSYSTSELSAGHVPTPQTPKNSHEAEKFTHSLQMARRASKYISIEAESDSEHESYGGSEDLDDFQPAVVQHRVKSYTDFAREMEVKYAVPEDEYAEEEPDTAEPPSQARLLPTPHSPLLFLVRCKIGREQDLCFRIMEEAQQSSAAGIFSIVQKEGLKGYLYIESFKKQNVEDLLAGVRLVYPGRLNIVPYKEMIEALTYKTEYVVSEFARIKNGKYKGDIVQIVENFEDVARVRTVPRINGARRLFDPEEHREDALKKDGGHYYNRDFYKDGYLVKIMLKSNLDFDVEPTFSELDSLNIKQSFDVNDTVRVSRGELTNSVGKVLNIAGRSATIQANNRSYELSVEDIEKYYSPGDEVSYRGANGVVLGMEAKTVVVGIRDFTEEIKCHASELQPPIRERAAGAPDGAASAQRIRRDPLINKRVQIIHGEHKGYSGVVKEVYRNKCRVQLNSTLEFTSVDRAALLEVDRPEYQPPVYHPLGSVTPGYKTPGYKTPGYKTPGYKTPGYKTPGYKTPSYRPERVSAAEEAETDWLTPKSSYDGALLSVKGELVILSDRQQDGQFVDRSGNRIEQADASYVVPQKYDNAVILEGDHAGKEGAIVTIGGDDCILRTADGSSYKVGVKDVSKKEVSRY